MSWVLITKCVLWLHSNPQTATCPTNFSNYPKNSPVQFFGCVSASPDPSPCVHLPYGSLHCNNWCWSLDPFHSKPAASILCAASTKGSGMNCRAAPTLEFLVAQGGNANAVANDGTKPINLVPKPDSGNLAGNFA